MCMDNNEEINDSKMHEKNQELKECIDLRACSFVNWYNKFHKVALQSVCVPLPDDIVNYLLDEIIILPKECYAREQSTSVAATNYSGAPSSFDAGEDDSTGTEVFHLISADACNSIQNGKLIRYGSISFRLARISRLQSVNCSNDCRFGRIGIHQNELAQSERCILDNCRANDVLQRHHRRVSIAQGVWYLQGGSDVP